MKSLTRREALALLTAGAAGAAGACFSSRPEDTTGPSDDVEIEMTPDLRFEPAVAQVEVGQGVVWRNTSTFVHTATGDPARADDPSNVQLPAGAQPWHSGEVPAQGTYRRTFTVPGTYRYFCVPHEGQDMVGTLVVS